MSAEMLRTLCEMDLAGFGERLFFRMLSSLKLSVITKAVKATGGRTPNLSYSELLLLYLMRRKS